MIGIPAKLPPFPRKQESRKGGDASPEPGLAPGRRKQPGVSRALPLQTPHQSDHDAEDFQAPRRADDRIRRVMRPEHGPAVLDGQLLEGDSPSTTATTKSPALASVARSTAMMSPSWIPASSIESPRTGIITVRDGCGVL